MSQFAHLTRKSTVGAASPARKNISDSKLNVVDSRGNVNDGFRKSNTLTYSKNAAVKANNINK